MRKRVWSLGVVLGLLAASCSDPAGGGAPEFLPFSDRECAVNEECTFTIVATDPDGDDLVYSMDPTDDIDPPPDTDTQGVGQRPQLRSLPDGGKFFWIPGIADAGDGEISYTVTFHVTDGDHEVSANMRLRVYAQGPGGRADITFTAPPGAGMAHDIARAPCVEFPVSVKADGIPGSEMALELGDPVPEGASMTPEGNNKDKTFYWCPTEAQLDLAGSYTVVFVANREGDGSKVTRRFTIHFKRPNDTGCPGTAPEIEHTPPGTLTGPLDYEIRARISDDVGFKAAPILVFSDKPGVLPEGGGQPDTAGWQAVAFAAVEGEAWQWVANIPNRDLAAGQERPVHYVIVATDNDDPDGTRCDHTTESQPFTFIAAGGEGGGRTYGFCHGCNNDEQCGGEADHCVDLGGELFCTVACDDSQCPAGQACVQLPSIGGRRDFQCVPDDLNCGQICVDDVFDAAERNDDPERPTVLLPGAHDDLSLCDPDIDYFLVDVAEGQSMRVTVRFDNARGDIDLAMHLPGDAEDFAYQSTLGDADEETVHEPCVAQSGMAYVAVFPYQSVRNTYSLDVRLEAGECDRVCDDDALDDAPGGNDDLNEFTAVDQLPFAREGLQICPLDPDFYAFEAEAGEFLRVSIAFEHALGDLQLRLRRSTGEVVAESLSFRDAELIEVLAPVDDVYVAEVFGATRSVATIYDLFVDKMLVEVCDSTRDCPAGQYCDFGACADAYCVVSGGCGEGHACAPPRAGLAPEAAGGECVDECFADGDCRGASGYACKRFEDYIPRCAPAGAAGPGERCSDYSDCAREQVCLNLPGGYCAAAACDDEPCPDGTVCTDLGGLTACLKRCGGDGDCRVGEGYGCQDHDGDGESVCLPCQARGCD